MKYPRVLVAFLSLFILFPGISLSAYFVTYKEQYYRLFHMHHNRNPNNVMENIYWLEKALTAPFCNPLFAMALIENETQWEKYRYLFMMHVNIKLAEQHLFLGNMWNKRNAYFYNAPWKKQNLASLETAETCFRTAQFYWEEALGWADKALDRRFRWINLQKVQFWEDEALRIGTGELNYERTINRELVLLQKIRNRFEAMNENTY